MKLAYCLPDDLKLLISERELVQLAAEGKPFTFESPEVQAVLVEAINQADTEIDSYIGMVPGILPFDVVPDLVSNLSAKIGVYNMLRRRPSMPDHWESEYKRCTRVLDKFAEGKLSFASALAADPAADQKADDNSAGIVTAEKQWS